MSVTIRVIKLKSEIIDQVKANLRVRNRIQFEMNISYKTLDRWLDKNNDALTKAQVLKVISEELNIDEKKLLTN